MEKRQIPMYFDRKHSTIRFCGSFSFEWAIDARPSAVALPMRVGDIQHTHSQTLDGIMWSNSHEKLKRRKINVAESRSI